MREGDAGKHGGQRAILARGPWVFTDGKGRATGETGDEWIAAVDLSSSFRVLSYSVAAPPSGGGGGLLGGVGVLGNRKLREASRMPQGLWRSRALQPAWEKKKISTDCTLL